VTIGPVLLLELLRERRPRGLALPGIGPKTASDLVARFGDAAGIFAHAALCAR
jgi:hypothetical protein